MSKPEPPHDIEAERAVLSAVLFNPDCLGELIGSLRPAEFYQDRHSTIYQYMMNVYSQGIDVDLVTLAHSLNARPGVLKSVGGPSYLSSLAGLVFTSSNVGHWVRIIKDHSRLREVITLSNTAIAEAYNRPDDVAGFVDNYYAKLLGSTVDEKSECKSVYELYEDIIQKIDDVQAGKTESWGLKTGLSSLDSFTWGFQPGDYIILMGRQGMGKTALALCIAGHIAFNLHKSVLFIGIDQSSNQLGWRLMSNYANVPLRRFIKSSLSTSEWARVHDIKQDVKNARFDIENKFNLTVPDILALCRRHSFKHNGLDMVFIDYITQIEPNNKRESRERQVSQISADIKKLSKNLKIPVMALAQPSRKWESRPENDRRPRPSDLRESGSLENDADYIFGIYRPFEDKLTVDDSETELLILKTKNFRKGKICLTFHPEYMRFTQIENAGPTQPTMI